MSKASTMAKTSARGGFNIFWGLAASTIISAVSLVVLARILPPSEFGLVGVTLTAPQFIMVFTDLGINSAIVKYSAQYRAENREEHLRNILNAGVTFQIVLGAIFMVICFLLSGFLATNVLQRPEIEPLIRIASLTIFAGVLATTAQSVFVGYERMELYAATQILQASIKGVLASALVIVGLGVFGAILGTSIAFVISGLISMLLYYLAIHRHIHKEKSTSLKASNAIKTMLKYGLPLSASAIIASFLLQFYNLLIAIYSSDASIGNFNVAVNFTVFITFFVTPIATVLFPLFSKINPKTEIETLSKTFRFSVKYAALFVTPAAAALIALAEPVIRTLFGQQYVEAPLYLALYVLVMCVYSAFGSMTVDNILNGLGRTKVTFALTLATLAIGLPLSVLLVPLFGIVGLIAATLVAGIPDIAIGLWWLKKQYTLSIDLVASSKILLSSVIAALVTYLVVSQIPLSSWLQLAVGAVVFIALYLTASPLLGSVNRADVRNLKQMLGGMGFVSKTLGIAFDIMERLAREPPAQKKEVSEP
ncbi:MAG: oligosaccharide flippase family protein [Candidatus Bathyarchaeota archaeon]|nr:oligosaccharide flippase family protein [Candidatus Bathyarchaeota archaeon]